jgi:hypothetical protein
MSREAHVRFWESAGVKLPRATHLHPLAASGPLARPACLGLGDGWKKAGGQEPGSKDQITQMTDHGPPRTART